MALCGTTNRSDLIPGASGYLAVQEGKYQGEVCLLLAFTRKSVRVKLMDGRQVTLSKSSLGFEPLRALRAGPGGKKKGLPSYMRQTASSGGKSRKKLTKPSPPSIGRPIW